MSPVPRPDQMPVMQPRVRPDKWRPKWLSAFALELAHLCQMRAAAEVTRRLRLAAKEHKVDEATVTTMVALEWERMGIVRIPLELSLRA